MPRDTRTIHARVLNFFQTADLQVAELVLGLAKDAVRGRREQAINKVAPKKSHHKKVHPTNAKAPVKVAAPAPAHVEQVA